MRVPDLQQLGLHAGVLPEATGQDSRLVLWVPATREGSFQHWARIGTVPRAAFTVEQGLCAIPAIAIPVRQRVRGIVGKLFGRLRRAPDDEAWILPSGEPAEAWGAKQTDLLLVWAADATGPLDQDRIQTRWPHAQRFQQLGQNLFLVSGVGPQGTNNEAGQPPPECTLHALAEQVLTTARSTGNRCAQVSALTDLGMAYQQAGDAQRALACLEEAWALARQLGDPGRERDVVSSLGLAVLAAGQPRRALELFEQELAQANAAGECFAVKTALDHLALAWAALGDSGRALAFAERAFAVARRVGDEKHGADLLWFLAIQHAELGQRDQAVASADAAIALFRKLARPQAEVYAEHLQKYSMGHALALPDASDEAGSAVPPAVFAVTGLAAPPASAPVPRRTASGPGVLRMALSAAASMGKFLGSGCKTVLAKTHQQRLQACASCEHHTGLRCRLCGCFTNAKAWLPHERCPLGKWPT